MKKVTILPLIFIFLFFSCTQLDKKNSIQSTICPKGFAPREPAKYITSEQVDEDCEYLKFLIPQTYINYESEESDFGFDINKTIDEISKLTKTKENPVEKKIDTREFLLYLNQEFKKNLHITDGHFTIYGQKMGGAHLFSSYSLYISDIYFEKKENNFFVIKSNSEQIKEGMKYSGKLENLYEWYSNTNKKIYRYCIFSNKNLSSGKISIENETYPVLFNIKSPELENKLFITEYKNYIYIKLSTFNFLRYDQKDNDLTKIFDDIIIQIKNSNTNKPVVVDLRDNTGGISSNTIDLLSAILFREDNYAYENLIEYEVKCLNYSYLDSSLIRNAEKELAVSNPEYESIKNDVIHKHEDLANKPDLSKNIVFTNNIYFLINGFSASCSEFIINMTYDFLPKERIKIIGTPSAGVLETGGCYEYYLPNSGIVFDLCCIKIHINENMNFYGDTKGIFPDVFADDNQIKEILDKLD